MGDKAIGDLAIDDLAIDDLAIDDLAIDDLATGDLACQPVALTRRGPLPYKPPNFSLGGLDTVLASVFSVPTRAIFGPYAARSGVKTGEADLSTEQAGAQASPWLSRPDGHQGRPQGRQCPPRTRSQALDRLKRRRGTSCLVPMERLKRRADFLAAAGGTSVPAAAFVLQARTRGDEAPARVGFTVSKKVGGATERNRVRRRLREVVRLSAAERLTAGTDYVLIGRRPALDLPFDRLLEDFAGALGRLQKRGPGRGATKTAARRSSPASKAADDQSGS
jgi:ribonuclease P protein component